MGFTVNLSLSTVANTLNGRGGIVALSCIDTSIGGAINSYKVGFSGRSDIANLTCFITGLNFAQTQYNGADGWEAAQYGVFSFFDYNLSAGTYPHKIIAGATVPGLNNISAQLSATGAECASGIQVGTLYATVSSTALSGTSAGITGAGVIPVTVNIIDNTNTTQVFCINTPVNQFVCQQDLSRYVSYTG